MLPCSQNNERLCIDYGAQSCSLITAIDDTKSDICRWDDVTTESACLLTYGLWATPSDRFAIRNPDTVLEGHSGSCTTQAKNLTNARYRRDREREGAKR